jgi:lipopolysaccharide transport system permease protein
MSLEQASQTTTSPYWLLKSLWRNRHIAAQLVKREVLARYKGSIMGLFWSFLNPVLMLAVYTFVFSVVFKARWEGGSDSKVEFALNLFAGLLVFNLFAECVSRAPSLILSNVNYVKKVLFPLEILPVIALGSAVFHFVVSLCVWLLFYVVFEGVPPMTALLLPLIGVPLIALVLGLTWFFSSLGVYIRDVAQILGFVIQVLMFMSPVFYPISALPEGFRTVVSCIPLNVIIEGFRGCLMWGRGIDPVSWLVLTVGCFVIAWLGFAWFQKTRKGFADVL